MPGVEIVDEPRYAWRGFMLDVSRSFFPADEVRTMIDQMAQYKMNVLHLHLSDDQGWRVAITNEGRVDGDDIDYSLLTSVGGGTAVTTAAWTDLPGRTGYFTAQEFADLIAYADARNIAIVPEIDGPAHSQSMLHSIPQLNSANSVPKPATGQTTAPHNPTTSVGESTLDVYNEYTYKAISHVFTQLVAANSTLVHGERYLHIGGDESFSTNNTDYRVYMDRVSDIVTDLDATPMVWHEAVNSAYEQLPAGTVIQQWNGSVSNLAKQHVNQRDGKIVISLANRTYLPQTPGNDVQGVTWACGGACGINQFYNWDPTATAGVAEDGVLGVEAAMWGEHVRTLTSIEGMIYPRLMVTAEVGWTPQSLRELNDFRERLTALGNNLADVDATLALDGQDVDVTVTVDRPLTYNPAKFDGRQVNGLFRFSIPTPLPVGDHTGTLEITAGSRSASLAISLHVSADETEPTEEPTDEPTDEPTQPTTPPATSEPTPAERPFSVYTTPGLHYVNGRHWWTRCEPYSVTERCRTEIWATTVREEQGSFVQSNGWTFNNLTYLPSPRKVWSGNPLGNAGSWTAADGRKWYTECDSATTGRNGCRSYTWSRAVVAERTAMGWSYSAKDQWVFNNIVQFG